MGMHPSVGELMGINSHENIFLTATAFLYLSHISLLFRFNLPGVKKYPSFTPRRLFFLHPHKHSLLWVRARK
jgi:hypothetical protein